MKPLILVTNDDGHYSKGLEALIEVSKNFGEVIVVAPNDSQSAMSHSITIKDPLRINLLKQEKNLTIYSTTGRPVDCVKLALNQILTKEPDLILSGINHGSNSSVSVLYSGTMGAVLEGCIYGISSIGFSLLDYRKDADFNTSKIFAEKIITQVLENKLSKGTCLNVNIPIAKQTEIKGIKICQQAKGLWREKFDKRTDPHGQDYYWLTGNFENHDSENENTDEFALKNNYISIVPVKIDLTDYNELSNIKNWKL